MTSETCVNVFYKNGEGFKCISSEDARAVVVIAGYPYLSNVDVLKADLTRCDSSIPAFTYKVHWHKVEIVIKFVIPFQTMIYLLFTLSISVEEPEGIFSTLPGQL